jgi:hypothetical protein
MLRQQVFAISDASNTIRPRDSWFGVWLDSLSLGFEAASVVGLRALTMGAGPAEALAEAQRMISEKIEVSLTLQMKAVTGGLGVTALSAATETLDHYRQRVLANRSRLLG